MKFRENLDTDLMIEYAYDLNKKNQNKIFRHFKGNLYLIQSVSYDCCRKCIQVNYKSLYNKGECWTRELYEFTSKVPDGKYNPTGQYARFEEYRPKSNAEFEEGD